MKTPLILSAILNVLFCISASQALSVAHENQDRLGGGDGSRITRRLENALNQDLKMDNLMLIKDDLGNHLHELQKRETLERRKRSTSSEERSEMSEEEDEIDEKQEKNRGLFQKIKDAIQPTVDKINFFFSPMMGYMLSGKGLADDESPHSTQSPPVTHSSCIWSENQKYKEILSDHLPDLNFTREGEALPLNPLAIALARAVEQKIISQHLDEEADPTPSN